MGPLQGLRVVEFDAIGPIPLCATLLADLGAEVVRLARPPSGAAVWEDVGGAVLHRGRPVVHLDLKAPDERGRAMELVARADALIEGFRPGVMERLGLGPEPCLQANPQLVYGRMTGWGQTGPLAPRAGHDIDYIALTGALHAAGEPGRPPVPALNLVGDYGGGAMFLALGVVSALLHTQRTGEGQVIDAGMTDGASMLMSLFYAFRATAQWGDARGSNLLDGSAPFYSCYTCADSKYLAVGALEPAFFALLLDGLGVERDVFVQNDRTGWPRMRETFAGIIVSRSRDEWVERFEGSDACVAPVLDLVEAPLHPHNVARRTFLTREGVVQPAPAPRFSATPGEVRETSDQPVGIDAALAAWTPG